MEVHRALSFNLHALTARLDRAADRILLAEEGMSYRKFLALFMVGELGVTTQRALANRLGVTDPSVSRMTAVLASTGLLRVHPEPTGGNRRQLSLTPQGKDLVERCCNLLESRMVGFVKSSGIAFREYTQSTKQLLAALEADERNGGHASALVLARANPATSLGRG